MLIRHRHHLYMQVDTIQQRTRYFIEVFLDSPGHAGTLLIRMVIIAARAWVHSSQQHEIGRKVNGDPRPADGDLPILHRLPHDFQHGSGKLRQLIQKEDSIMRQ